MATKAERFRAAAERSGAPKPKKAKAPRRDKVVDTSKPGVSATDRKSGAGKGTARRNRSKDTGEKKTVALENSETGRPSRKSTRKSANRAKSATNLQRRATRRARSPKARAAKAAVSKGKR